MSPWLRVAEAWLVQQLLRTPAFHRAVEKVAKQVHRVRHGIPPEELGGTKIDQPGNSGFLNHFLEEVKTQLGEKKVTQSGGVNMDSRAMGHSGVRSAGEKQAAKVDEESAEAAWREVSQRAGKAPKQSFLGEYTEALRQQMKAGKK